MPCPSCGSTQTGIFCRACGARVLPDTTQREAASSTEPATAVYRVQETSSITEPVPTLPVAPPPPAPQPSPDQAAYKLPTSPQAAYDPVGYQQPTHQLPAYQPLGGATVPADPRDPRKRAGWVGPVIAAGLVLALVGAGALWWFLWRPSSTAPVVAQGTATSPSSSPTPSSSLSSSSPSAASSSTSASPSSSATVAPEVVLNDLRAADLPTLVLDGHWVVQLASKYNGVVDQQQLAANGTHTFGDADILAEHEALRSRFGPGIKLIGGKDMGKRSSRPQALWMTIYDQGTFGSEADVTNWCASVFPDKAGEARLNVCLPRKASPPHS